MKLLDEKHNLNLTHAPDVKKKKKLLSPERAESQDQ